jgi:hypothetical protein
LRIWEFENLKIRKWGNGESGIWKEETVSQASLLKNWRPET